MFGNDSLPSRFYSYGAKPPVEAAEFVDQQMELARRYRNALVAVERDRRRKTDAALCRMSPDLVRIEAAITATNAELNHARNTINQVSAFARTKVIPAEAAKRAGASATELKRLCKERKAIRTELFASEAWEPIGAEIDGRAEEKKKRLYATIGRMGLYWGTRLFIGTTVDRSGPPPQFSRRDGGGHLAVQVQHGISPEEAFAGRDRRIQIDPLPIEEPPDFIGPRLSKAARLRTRVRFRVGSDESGAPVFAVIPIVLHRPIPWDAKIKWVHLVRRRIGTHCEWRVQFVLSRAIGWNKPDCAAEGTVSIDVGWRVTGDDGKTRRKDGSMRVAYWKGSDGNEGELALPGHWMSGMRKTEDIQSIRDKNMNKMRADFVEWFKNQKNLPDWLREAARTVAQWKSQARLARLVIRWRDARFQGDDEIFKTLEEWRKHDRHLCEYQSNLRDQLQNRRTDIFRNFIAERRRAYHTARVEKLDLRDFHETPEAEQEPKDGALKEHVRDACLSELLKCIKEGMAETVLVNAKNTTAKCHACGSIQTWNRKILRHRCTACGTEWDQDDNAATNIGA